MAHMEVTPEGKVFLRDDWHIDDVLSIAPWATELQAIEVLESTADGFDANLGINWDILEYWVAVICPKPDDYVESDDE
jgi:hypothetical protein